jgi:succinate dehydrogenase/fumarate reductase cytochrome b subunit
MVILELHDALVSIAFAFILWHIIQLHWMGAPLGGGRFDPHHATSSAATVVAPLGISLLYAIGVLSAVFHLSNGLWTIGITWGLWTSPAAMQRANVVSIVVGVVLAAAGLGAIGGLRATDVAAARQIETRMDDFKRMMEGQAPEAAAGGHGAPASTATVPAADAIELRTLSEPSRLAVPATAPSPAGN